MNRPDAIENPEAPSAPASLSSASRGSLFGIPLIVDLDGTLVQTDLLYESFFASIKDGAKHHWLTFDALRRGRAPLKAYLAGVSTIDYASLPFNADVIKLINQAKAEGRPVYLATASNRRHADSIAAHLGIFDGVFCSEDSINLAGEAKARALVDAFGERGFDYFGNSFVDLAIWSHARQAYIASNQSSLRQTVEQRGVPVTQVTSPRSSLRIWLKALRIHQYAKNALIFVPALTAHAYSLQNLLSVLLAFVSFSLCASSAYLLNDLVDCQADRQHPTKRNRSFASGAIPAAHGVAAIPILVLIATICALSISALFTLILFTYLALTLAYSLTLKRRLIVDVVVLATLYTIRVIAGAAAIPVVPSEWLLAFSMFIFFCLALAKRYIELATRLDKDLPDPSNRNYRLMDLPTIGALAAASGFNAVTIFALYVNSPPVSGLYRHQRVLWLICPILMYWLSRILVLAHRRVVDDDPIVFALRDRNSRICAVAMIAVVLLAI
jgi:4-hydroxybenzoate polyprenyltransferase/phosphoserine phosphatase